jgi:hypothetical protein
MLQINVIYKCVRALLEVFVKFAIFSSFMGTVEINLQDILVKLL